MLSLSKQAGVCDPNAVYLPSTPAPVKMIGSAPI